MPIVAVFAEGRFPDVPVKASDDRLRIPGAQTPGRGEEVAKSSAFRCPQPGEIKGQASGDRLHFPGVQAMGGHSPEVPEWVSTFRRRPLCGVSRLTHCRGGTACS